VFAELELQAGKIVNAKTRLDEILPQAVRGDDLELQGSVCALYAKVLLAQIDDPFEAEGEDSEMYRSHGELTPSRYSEACDIVLGHGKNSISETGNV